MFGELTDQSIDLLIVSTNLDGLSLTNHGRFAKFAEHFPCQNFLLYGIKTHGRVSAAKKAV